MKPTQMYFPRDFKTECEKIYSTCIKVIENGRNVYYDSENNRYQIDGADGSITVN